MKSYLVFGSHGSIGEATTRALSLNGDVTRAPREISKLKESVSKIDNFDSVIWAHGINTSDSIREFNLDSYNHAMDVNTSYILSTLKILLNEEKIKSGSQLVVVSSIWGLTSKPEKLSYTISKAATKGLVKSVATDLGPEGISINAVSPGPIDNKMTKNNLNEKELDRIIAESPLKRLVTLSEVVNIIVLLANGELKGITGQELTIDAGWTVSKLV